MRKILAILLVTLSIFTMCSCEEKSIKVTENTWGQDIPYMNLIECRRGDLSNMYLLYDYETGVEYFFICSGYRGGLCPRYDKDGKVMIYDGE